ncbi:TMEM27: Collectrin [Crotalus adamanteus]|uniref:TMEM27: Collectrin n=1 Tax=Crotalus adamanteus TaxID=8729 RepID=A0AAW1BIZ4_CROAD
MQERLPAVRLYKTYLATKFSPRHKNAEETDNLDDKYEAAITMENRIPCHTLDLKAGQINGFYAAADDDWFTPI